MIMIEDSPMYVGYTDHCVTSLREFLVVYGGFDDETCRECYELLIYNTLSGIWRSYMPPIDIKSTPLYSSICANGNMVYIFGGSRSRDDDQPTNSLVRFDISNHVWDILFPHTEVFNESTPNLWLKNLLFYHCGSLYLIGINEEHELSPINKFSLETSTWSLVHESGEKPTLICQIFGTVYKDL
ncbi:hypothetical protein RF11_04007 [Thelohanellus kitauei]|uniref:Kelch domain-containing protein 10 n=1 Tax=Thelohanellus kitauei TaxID=669202 RepID=A0A0C2MYM3_THEKT|nr:hypothetical protein RF11_04007 [Thelohanellus kitauei]